MIRRLRAWVRNGRIETDGPLAFQEGTELTVSPVNEDDVEWDNSPEGIRRWLAWYDSLEPLLFTAEELQRQGLSIVNWEANAMTGES